MTGAPEPVEHHIAVTRTARYWSLGGADPAHDLWIVLHGYKQLARRFLRRFEGFATPGRRVVAPEALSRFYVRPEPGRHGPESVVGATWMTREDRLAEIEDYVSYLDRVADQADAGGRGTTVLGFSQGVATAARWVVQGRVRPVRLVLWGDALPPDLDMAAAADALADVEVALVRGARDPSLDAGLAASEEERLAASGVRFRVEVYEGGHDIDGATLERLAAG